jgi:hypothetical protein
MQVLPVATEAVKDGPLTTVCVRTCQRNGLTGVSDICIATPSLLPGGGGGGGEDAGDGDGDGDSFTAGPAVVEAVNANSSVSDLELLESRQALRRCRSEARAQVTQQFDPCTATANVVAAAAVAAAGVALVPALSDRAGQQDADAGQQDADESEPAQEVGGQVAPGAEARVMFPFDPAQPDEVRLSVDERVRASDRNRRSTSSPRSAFSFSLIPSLAFSCLALSWRLYPLTAFFFVFIRACTTCLRPRACTTCLRPRACTTCLWPCTCTTCLYTCLRPRACYHVRVDTVGKARQHSHVCCRCVVLVLC